jgi:hypothetical protein
MQFVAVPVQKVRDMRSSTRLDVRCGHLSRLDKDNATFMDKDIATFHGQTYAYEE